MHPMQGAFLFLAVALTMMAIGAFVQLDIGAGVMISFMAWAAWQGVDD